MLFFGHQCIFSLLKYELGSPMTKLREELTTPLKALEKHWIPLAPRIFALSSLVSALIIITLQIIQTLIYGKITIAKT